MNTEIILDAVNDFIIKFTDMPQKILFRGWQNRTALPTTNEYCVYSIYETERVGTNKQGLLDDEEVMRIETLRQYTVEIAIYDTEHDRALERASNLETICRSLYGTDFFREHEMGMLFSEDIRYVPFTDSNKQFLHKYVLHINVTHWDKTDITQDTAKEVSFDKKKNPANKGIVNVDQLLYRK